VPSELLQDNQIAAENVNEMEIASVVVNLLRVA
jgi:hypothetical protein